MQSLIDQINSSGLIPATPPKLSTTSSNANSNQDYQQLFSAYSALNNLKTLAQAAQDTNATTADIARIQAAFVTGQQQLSTYLQKNPFKEFTLLEGQLLSSDTSSVSAPSETDTYQTKTLWTGDINDVVTSLPTSLNFQLTVHSDIQKNDQTLNFNLADMGSTPLTLPNIVSYFNGKLAQAGYSTRFSVASTPDSTAPSGVTRYLLSLQINGSSLEHLTFSDPSSTPAVYVAQTAGYATTPAGVSSTDPAQQQLLKLNADPSQAATKNAQVFKNVLSAANVDAVTTGPDGAVYVLTNETGKTSDGQAISGSQDEVLTRYDSAGNVAYVRNLGAKSSASGYSLSVSADGNSVAVAGTVTGDLDATDTATASTAGSDTVVTVYSAAQGDEQWTTRVGSPSGDDHPTAVTFGADGSVYVAGQTTAALNSNETQVSTSDNYLIGLSSTGQQSFATQYGAATGGNHASGVTVSGSQILVAGVENGQAIVRAFNSSGTQTAQRNLGTLNGGDIAGITTNSSGQVIVAGSTTAPLSVANTVTASDGKQDVFVAQIDSSLTASANDKITYQSLGSNATTSGLSLSNGVAYVAGQKIGSVEKGYTQADQIGYVTGISLATGQPVWQQSLTNIDGQDAIKGVAVAQNNSSAALDALGLPTGTYSGTTTNARTGAVTAITTGTINWLKSDPISQAIIQNPALADPLKDGLPPIVNYTSIRPGDSFYITVNGTKSKISIAADDTLQSLADKINQATTNFASATVSAGHLKIVPANTGTNLTISPGQQNVDAITGLTTGTSYDALQELGLTAGVITGSSTSSTTGSTNVTSSAAKPKNNLSTKPYSLNLGTTLSVSTTTGAQAAVSGLQGAINTVQAIYRAMTTPYTPPQKTSTSSQPVPKYLTNEIANYQAALSRLSAFTGTSSS